MMNGGRWLLEQSPRRILTPAAVAAVAPRPLGVLNYHPLPAQLLPVQVIHSIVGVPGVVKLNEPVPAGAFREEVRVLPGLEPPPPPPPPPGGCGSARLRPQETGDADSELAHVGR